MCSVVVLVLWLVFFSMMVRLCVVRKLLWLVMVLVWLGFLFSFR